MLTLPASLSSPRVAVGALAVTVSVAYGALFYGFSVLLTRGAAGGAFSTTVLSTAYGGAVLTAGSGCSLRPPGHGRSWPSGGSCSGLLLGRAPRLPFPAADAMTGVPGRALRDRRFLLFTLAAVLGYGALEAVIVHRVARFAEAGFPVATVTAWAPRRPSLRWPAPAAPPSPASSTTAPAATPSR
jgi:hypothetical protein